MQRIPAVAFAAVLCLAPIPDVYALERLHGMSRDARSVQVWLLDQTRGTGTEFAGLRWRPTIPLSAGYNDNIFATDGMEESDGIVSLTPSLLADGRSGRYDLSLSAWSRSNLYVDETDENNSEYGAGGQLRVEVLEWLGASLRYRYDRLHEDRDSPDIPLDATEPPEFEQWTAKLGLHPHFGRFFADFEFLAGDVTYEELEVAGGVRASQSYRNRDTVHIMTTFAYEVSDTFRPYAQLIWNDHGYDDWPLDRDGSGKSAFIGARFASTNAFTADIYAGYIFQNYGDDDARLDEAKGIGFGAELAWQYSDALRLRLDALREIEEATSNVESGRLATTMLFRADYRWTERITLEGTMGYGHDAYGTSPRDDDSFRAGIGVLATFGTDLYSRLAYSYSTRDSNEPGRSYDRNEVWLTAGWRL